MSSQKLKLGDSTDLKEEVNSPGRLAGGAEEGSTPF